MTATAPPEGSGPYPPFPLFPLRAVPFALPLVASFRGLTQRAGMVLEGPGGWGEFAPFADYTPLQDALWLAAAVEAAAGLEPAPADGHEVPVNAILPDVADDQVASAAAELITATGCRVLKLKVGARPVAADVRRVRDAVSGTVQVRLDGNGLLSVAETLELLRGLEAAGVREAVQYLEQPCASAAELRQLRRADPDVRIAVDETIRRDRDLAAAQDVADVAICKVAPLGGSRTVATWARSLGLPVVLSGAAESSVGLGRDVRVAAGMPAGFAHGLGTGTLLAADLCEPALTPRHGVLTNRASAPDPQLLAAAQQRLPPTQRTDWQERLQRAWCHGLEHELMHPNDLQALGVPT